MNLESIISADFDVGVAKDKVERNYDFLMNDYMQSIEDRAREWLDLSYEQGQNLFLLNIDSVWTYYIEKCNFGLIEDEDCFTNITNKDAALVIRDVANGVIDIDKKIYFEEAREYLQELGYYEERDEY